MDRSGSIREIDSSLAALEGSLEEWCAYREQRKEAALVSLSTCQKVVSESDENINDKTSDDETFTYDFTTIKKHRIISSKVNAVLDRTNTSVRKASMVAASVLNALSVLTSTFTLTKALFIVTGRSNGSNQPNTSVKLLLEEIC